MFSQVIKRAFDLIVSGMALLLFSPLLLVVCFLVWRQDYHSPFYVAQRVGKNSKNFKMIKLRSMLVNADKSGVDSTGANDPRITKIGHFIRAYKLDELSQLLNVFEGKMSFVGPRPNVPREVALYTDQEKKLVSVKPGITDFASIVFSDEGEILKSHADPDIAYHQLIRPWKSRLGIFYIEHRSFWLDLQLIYLTAVAIFSRKRALQGVVRLLKQLRAPDDLVEVALRKQPLVPTPPPGADEIVTSRET